MLRRLCSYLLPLAVFAPLACDGARHSAGDGGSGGAGTGTGGRPPSQPVGLDGLECDPPSVADQAFPEGGAAVFSGALSRWAAAGVPGAVEKIAVEGQEFTEAWRSATDDSPLDSWSVQLGASTNAPVASGDVLLAEFWVRCERSLAESAECRTEFAFELGQEPYTKSVTFPASAGREWRRFLVPFVSADSYPAGAANVLFRLGYPDQTMDIGGVRLENFGKELSVDDLPRSRLSYGGMEDGAAWRSAAEERIEQLRKGDLTITVVDADGAPVPAAEVEVRMTRHAFSFGTAISAHFLQEQGHTSDGERYKKEVVELFNAVTLENALKSQPLAGDWGPSWTMQTAEDAIAWATGEGLGVRGHVLVWPSWRNSPASYQALADDPEALREAVNQHIDDVAGAMAGKLMHWDVLNEPYDNHDITDILGEEEMIAWFTRARAADPVTPLFINDYAILSGGDGNTAHRDHYESTIELLVDGGAPLDGIGMQGHFGGSLTSMPYVLELLDRYGRFEKQIVVSEYDIDIDDAMLAGCYTRDFMTALFSHERVTGFFMWGFWDTRHWKENAPIYDTDWNIKTSGLVYKDLVLDRWWTRETRSTDADGSARVRGFHGDYEIVVRVDGKETLRTLTLGADGANVAIEVE